MSIRWGVILEAVGAGAVLAGIWYLSPPAALIVAGVGVLLVANGVIPPKPGGRR